MSVQKKSMKIAWDSMRDVRVQVQRHLVLAILSFVVVAAIILSYLIASGQLEKKAVLDIRPTWYIHGLILFEDFGRAQEGVDPFNIKLVASSCILGGDEYEKEVKSNNAVYAAASEELKMLLNRLRPFY